MLPKKSDFFKYIIICLMNCKVSAYYDSLKTKTIKLSSCDLSFLKKVLKTFHLLCKCVLLLYEKLSACNFYHLIVNEDKAKISYVIVLCNHCHWSCWSKAETKLSYSCQERGLTWKSNLHWRQNKLLEQKNKWTKVSMPVSQF